MRKMPSVVLISMLFLVPSAQAGQEAKPEQPAPRHRFLNLSLFYPVSLNRSKLDTANLSLSLLYGHLGSVRGLDLSLGAAAVEGSLEGIQLAGLIAAAGESMEGGQAAGLICAAGDRGRRRPMGRTGQRFRGGILRAAGRRALQRSRRALKGGPGLRAIQCRRSGRQRLSGLRLVQRSGRGPGRNPGLRAFQRGR